MKSHIVFTVIGLLLVSSAHAQDSKSKSKSLSYGGWGTGVVTGIAGVKAVRTGNQIKNASIQDLMQNLRKAELIHERDIQQVAAPIENGDEIIVRYHYNQTKNKVEWMKETKSNISSAKSSASYHDMQAMTAMRTVYNTTTDHQGNTHTTTTYEPDFAQRMLHSSSAQSARDEAEELTKHLERVKSGAEAAPLLEVEERILEKAEAQETVKSFLRKEAADGSKLYYVSRFPREARLKAIRAKAAGRVLIGVAIFSAAIGTWEYLSGDVSNYLSSKGMKFSNL